MLGVSSTVLWSITALVSVSACVDTEYTGTPAETGHQAPDTNRIPDTGYRIPGTDYDFANPDGAFELDNDLREISGLTFFDDRHLAAVEDEHGRFYLIDIETGDITAERKFSGKDDYEGIERAGDRLFALRSDGRIVEIEDFDTDDPDDEKIDTPLRSSCDAEGLAFDKARNRLLVACKEVPGRNLGRQKAIYAFDLESMEMDETPVYTIPTDTIGLAVGRPRTAIEEFFYPLLGINGFKPSGLAIHPMTGDLFVLSSVLKIIVVLKSDGSVRTIEMLDADLFEQPEGIAFLPNGDLFIASEGVGRKARLVRFNYRPDRESR